MICLKTFDMNFAIMYNIIVTLKQNVEMIH